MKKIIINQNINPDSDLMKSKANVSDIEKLTKLLDELKKLVNIIESNYQDKLIPNGNIEIIGNKIRAFDAMFDNNKKLSDYSLYSSDDGDEPSESDLVVPTAGHISKGFLKKNDAEKEYTKKNYNPWRFVSLVKDDIISFTPKEHVEYRLMLNNPVVIGDEDWYNGFVQTYLDFTITHIPSEITSTSFLLGGFNNENQPTGKQLNSYYLILNKNSAKITYAQLSPLPRLGRMFSLLEKNVD